MTGAEVAPGRGDPCSCAEPARQLQQPLCVHVHTRACARRSLQLQPCKAVEAKSDQLTFHHPSKKVFSFLKTYRQPPSCDISFGISILRSSENLCQQITLLKHLVKQTAYPFLPFWNTSLPIKGLFVTCKQRTWSGWHDFVLSTLTLETMPQNNYNARPAAIHVLLHFTQTSGTCKVRLCTGTDQSTCLV